MLPDATLEAFALMNRSYLGNTAKIPIPSRKNTAFTSFACSNATGKLGISRRAQYKYLKEVQHGKPICSH